MSISPQIKLCRSNLRKSNFYRKLDLAATHLFYKKHLREIANLKVAVHLHLYYIDLLDEFIENLKNIPIPFDLYITLVDRPSSDIQKIFEIFPRTKVFTLPNIGRDLGGLVEVINNIEDLGAYDALIKIHSKKSLHTGQEQKDWRQRLVKTLLGSRKQTAAILHKFCNKKTGMVGSFEDLSYFKSEDQEKFKKLCQRLEIVPQEIFFRGTMFAIRPEILKRFIEKKICLNDFDGYLNHGMEYAMEYAFGSLCISQCYKIEALESIGNKKTKKPSKKLAKLKTYLTLQKLN
jgi:lipopolysaccharide biosynthesis protein